ncbi:CDK-activating kinase assembly factor MAT1-domain-containing protein [Emericellopsis atlantica]|uniref:CDK-activating kinase assembly factor MAT1-domain-containing protein n=1 Tax=Emericellopsis atlantica TaxID=2614577 RepID=A0A9P8CRL2_9HYPO|nr:CDK-activating kinase assembly factor MAT1-domain-containing protein [Emericellopsis atlantica]KAG9254851.1 CDK-activating kinase assembly factor MAT1-domain-containing protein [Emericellopsis atlantica]
MPRETQAEENFTLDRCPACGRMRYLNHDMEFRVSTICYHAICTVCIRNNFHQGPSKCPIMSCGKTLRTKDFKKAWFQDLGIQREVDIRRRVATVFNKVEEDFQDLDSYNAYLEDVECLTDDLVNGDDDKKKLAELKLQQWEAEHRAEIERNRRLANESEATRRKRMAAEEALAQQRRELEIQEEAEEKLKERKFREEMLDSLQQGEQGKANEAVNKILLKKRGQHKKDVAMEAAGAPALSIRGLVDKKRTAAVVDEGPYDPFMGLDLLPTRVDVSKERLAQYDNDTLKKVKMDDAWKAGGYSAEEYLSRALFEAFAGLGVFVDEEMGERGVSTQGAAQAAATGVTGGKMDID